MLARKIEEAALRAWPALWEMRIGGWVLRFAEGYTKRANSINPLDPPAGDLPAAVEECERIYGERGMPPIFRLARPFVPAGLDALLEARGYAHADPTLVMHLDLVSFPGDAGGTGDAVRETPLDAWFPVHAALAGVAPERRARHRAILEAIAPARLFAVREEADEAAACGLGVLDGGLFGLFDLVTAPERRGWGHGTALVGGMLRWARDRGASHAYLQVMESNALARRLYEKLGFRTVYDYWYRLPPG